MARPSKIAIPILVLLSLLPFQNCSETLPEKATATDGSSNGPVQSNGFTFSATSTPGTVLPGSAISFKSNINATQTLQPGSVDVTIRHANQTVIWTDSKNHGAMTAGQSAVLSHDFAVPETMPPGVYTVSASINAPNNTTYALGNVSTFTVQNPIRVNVGASAPYTDTQGRVWAADFGFSGLGVVANEVHPPTQNSPDQPLWDNFRWGSGAFAFTTPVPGPGKYKVTLRWTEHYVFAAGLRLFNVSINGTPVLTEFDLFTAAGGAYLAYDRSFVVTTAQPSIRIDFTHGSIENPKISAIEILGAP